VRRLLCPRQENRERSSPAGEVQRHTVLTPGGVGNREKSPHSPLSIVIVL